MAITKIKKELKLNKFEYVNVPHPRNLVGRTGYAVMPSSQYTGDEQALLPTDKIHQLQYGYKMISEDSESSKTE